MTDPSMKTSGQLLYEELNIEIDKITIEAISHYVAVQYYLTVELVKMREESLKREDKLDEQVINPKNGDMVLGSRHRNPDHRNPDLTQAAVLGNRPRVLRMLENLEKYPIADVLKDEYVKGKLAKVPALMQEKGLQETDQFVRVELFKGVIEGSNLKGPKHEYRMEGLCHNLSPYIAYKCDLNAYVSGLVICTVTIRGGTGLQITVHPGCTAEIRDGILRDMIRYIIDL